MSERLLRRREVIARLGNINAATLWRWVQGGHFPQPVQLTPGTVKQPRVAWIESEVQNWIETRPRGFGSVSPNPRAKRKLPQRSSSDAAAD